MDHNTELRHKTASLAAAMALAIGSPAALAVPTPITSTFTMYQPCFTADCVGVTFPADAAVVGNFDIANRTFSIASTAPFSGLTWTASSGTLYGPGTYTIDVNGDGANQTTNTGANVGSLVTFTVPAGHVGGNINFAWGATVGIDVILLWDAAGASLDMEDTDGSPGMAMADGPFPAFNASFTMNPSPAANIAPAVANRSVSTSPGTAIANWAPSVTDIADAIVDIPICNIASQPIGGVGVATIAPDCSSGSFDPQGLPGGSVVTFTYRADDGHFFNNTSIGTVTVTVSAVPPPVASDTTLTVNGTTGGTLDLAPFITDGDGNQDLTTLAIASPASYGTAISNGDGTVTYIANSGFSGIDSFTYTVQDGSALTSNSATVTVTVRATAPASSTGVFTPGTLAASVGSTTGGGLTTANVGTDSAMSQQCIGGCFDFAISSIVGSSARVVLPLSTSIPATTPFSNQVVYRKLVGATWQNFDTTGGNAIASAAAISTNPLICPAAGSSDYTTGLSAGHRCLRLTIVDGGPNDADGLVNGTVVDPGGIGLGATVTSTIDDPSIGTSGGGGAAGWWTLAGLLTLLGIQRRWDSR